MKTSHPEEPQLLGAVTVPGDWIEGHIHSQLKAQEYHISEAPGTEWFKFPSPKILQDFLDKLYRAVIIDDFSELGGGRRDIQGESFESIISAFGVKKLNGSAFKSQVELIKIIDEELSPLYPGFPQWLDRTINDSSSIFNVAYRDERAVGVAIWKPKGNRIAKLSTLFVTEEYRRSGIGRNLILTCLEQWKVARFKRAFVTTAKVELVSFFERYGFWVEGIGREIYERERHEPEWFLTKLLFDNPDQNDLDAVDKAKILFPPIIKSSYNSSGRKEVAQLQSSNAVVQLKASDETLIDKFPLHSWFNLTYPAESIFTSRTAYVIPIRPQFLIQIFQAGKTVYYGRCSRIQDDMRGALIMFYASQPISGVVAIARIVDRYIGAPTQLYKDLGIKGVLSLQEIGSEEQRKQAVEFDHLLPLKESIGLDDLKSNGILNGPPQSMHSLSLSRHQKAVEIGGTYAG